ncbi:MAG: helix-turn-helix transcriptional regulator [Ruminococcaceae bacterium]|nr:helix-turn-helix transcriptional regulator [Oscillospiraceae bacterium]
MPNNHQYADLVRCIRVYRAENFCTNKEVAERAGISYSKLIAFISNTRVDDDTARAISRAIGYGIYATN